MQTMKRLTRISPLIAGIIFMFFLGLARNAEAITCDPCTEEEVTETSCTSDSAPCTCSDTHNSTPIYSYYADDTRITYTVGSSCSCGGYSKTTCTIDKKCKKKPDDSSSDKRDKKDDGSSGDKTDTDHGLGLRDPRDKSCISCNGGNGNGKNGNGKDGGGSAGSSSPDVGCVNNRFSLGYDELGKFMGYLWIYTNTPSVELATPEGLQLLAYGDKLDVLTEESNTNILRQVKSPACLADIVSPLDGQTSSAPYYRIDFYRSADVGEGTNGYYQPNAGANPFAQYYIENLSGLSNACEELRIRGGITGGITTNIYTYQTNGNEAGWSLAESGGYRNPQKTRVLNGTNELVDTETMRDAGQNLVSETRTTWNIGDWGMAITEKAVDPNGANLRTTYSYYENESETGKYMRVNTVVNSDGSWKKYDYDGVGRVTKIIQSWLNTASSAGENEAKVILKDYTPVDGSDDGIAKPANPRTVTEKIEDNVVAKTYYAYYENEYGELVTIEEKCTDVSSSYGSANNLRATKIYYPKSSTAASSEQIKLYEHSNGRRDSYTYEYGTFVSNANPAQVSFTADPTGDCLRITSVYDTTNGTVAGKSTKETVVNNAFGSRLMSENYVCTDSTNYTRVGWTVTAVDDLGHPIRVDRSNGTYTEATWSCCGKEWEKDGSGIEYSYTYDALKRLIQKVKSGTATQADQYTTYTYDAEDRLLTETISASGLSQGRTNQYDMAGRLTNSTDIAGLVTRTAYSQDGLTTTETLPGGYTRITERYKDGQIKSITGTAQISQHYEYGACPEPAEGSQWVKVYSTSNNSPVWVKTTTDLLGRTAKLERPGYSGTETTEYTYNSKGQLIRQTVDSGPSTVVTLYAYDEVGNQIQSGLDVNSNGTLDLAGTDRITESDKSYVQINNDWFLQTINKIYATDNSADAITNNITRQRLTGFTGNLVAETISLDAYGNQTVSQTTIDRSNKKVTQIVDVSDSSSNIVTIAINGLIQSQTSKTGLTTAYAYDDLGRRNTVTDARLGNAVTHYDSHGWVDYVQDTVGNRTTFTYNSATGRKLSQTDALSNVTYYSYLTSGALEKTWGSAVYPVLYEYDGYGRMVKMSTYRGGSGWSGPTWPANPGTADTTEWIYHEASGLLIAKKDATGKQVSYTYSAGGKLATRVWARTVEAGHHPPYNKPLVTSYSYSSAGDLTGIDYSDSTPDVSFTYDRLGRQKTAESSVSSHTFAYNGLLLDTETIVSSGGTNVIDRSYDGYGRSTGFTLGSDYSVAYGYDTLGRFASASSASLAVNYSYLQNSDLIEQRTMDSGLQTTFSYEQNRNLLTQVKNEVNSSTLSQYDYANDAGGRRVAVRYSGSAFEVGSSFNLYGYNSRSEVQTADRYFGTNPNNLDSPVPGQSYAYSYDPIGNRTVTMRDNEESIYTANNLNQYLQRTVPGKLHVSGSAKADAVVTVNSEPVNRYNKYWHKTLDVNNTGKAAYPEINVLGVYNPETEGEKDIVSEEKGHIFVSKSPEKFTYDADGSLTQDGRFNYEWDCENRLIGVETRTDLHMKVPRVKVTFRYDYMGRRVMKHVHEWNKKQHWARKTVSSFLYDGWNLLEERRIERCKREWEWRGKKHRWFEAWEQLFADDDCEECEHAQSGKGHDGRGKWKCKHKRCQKIQYVWGLDLSGTLQGAGGIGGLLCMIPSTGGAANGQGGFFYTFDGNGNVSELLQSSVGGPPSSVAAHYEYSPFGETIVATGLMAKENPFRFSTKYWDNETGLNYYGYRYYSPSVGRWLARDPMGDIAFRRDVTVGTVSVTALSEEERAYLASLQKISSKKYSESMAKFNEATQEEALKSLSYTEHNLYLLLSNDAVNRFDYLGLGIFDPQPQTPGCDMFPDFNKCATSCCNEHDRCFEKYGCRAWWSWPLTGGTLPPFFSECVRCNQAVVGCLAGAVIDPCCWEK